MKKKHDAATLIAKYQNGSADARERLLVEAFMLIDLEDESPLPDEEQVAYRTAQIGEKLKKNISYQETAQINKRLYAYRLLRSPFIRIAAVFVIAITSILTILHFKNERLQLDAPEGTQVPMAVVTPGGNKAYITTADGHTIDLNEAQNTVRVGKDIAYNDGTVIWSSQTTGTPSSVNTLYTPKGGNYTVILSDGTQVTLNASSKLSYPSRFNPEQRSVELDGEAFFEVRPALLDGKRIPFIVKTKSQEVEVLGTAFNIKDYADEKLSKTTLINGSVRVKAAKQRAFKLLSPGQEATIHDDAIHSMAVDTAIALGWKNGLIYFNDENLASIMKKIERWYDVDIEFQNVDSQMRFGGSVSKYKNLSDVLHRLELTGDVKFITKGRRVIVTK